MSVDEREARRRIGVLLAGMRTRNGMSQIGLARASEIDIRTIKGLEDGTKWPWDANRGKIEVALGLEAGTLERWRNDPDSLTRDEGMYAATTGSDAKPATDPAGTSQVAMSAADQLRAANIAVAAERMRELVPEDIARVQEFIDALGRARFADWDDRWGGDYDLAWHRRAQLGPVSPDIEKAMLEAVDRDRD